MDRLEELKAKRREIDAEIKALMGKAVVYEGAKLDKEHYPTCKPDEWGVYIYRRFDEDLNRRPQWQSVIRSTDRQKCIGQIAGVIADLQGLLRKLDESRDTEREVLSEEEINTMLDAVMEVEG